MKSPRRVLFERRMRALDTLSMSELLGILKLWAEKPEFLWGESFEADPRSTSVLRFGCTVRQSRYGLFPLVGDYSYQHCVTPEPEDVGKKLEGVITNPEARQFNLAAWWVRGTLRRVQLTVEAQPIQDRRALYVTALWSDESPRRLSCRVAQLGAGSGRERLYQALSPWCAAWLLESATPSELALMYFTMMLPPQLIEKARAGK